MHDTSRNIVDASEVYFWLMRITFLISNLKMADTENDIANLIKGVEGVEGAKENKCTSKDNCKSVDAHVKERA